MKDREKIQFETEEGALREFFVEEETRVAGCSYLLVSDSEEEEANAYILKDVSADGESMATYVMVEEEQEWEAIAALFEQMVEETIERT